MTGTYQRMVACHETFHTEKAMLEIPGKDKFSAERIVLDLPVEMASRLSVGAQIRIEGTRQAAVTRKVTKAQVRERMYKHVSHRDGLAWHCVQMAGIIEKIRVEPEGQGKPQGNGHDHGELKLAAMPDDQELVEIHIPAHIVVTKVDIIGGVQGR